MYYKFTLEKSNPDMNTFQKTQIMVSEEMVQDNSLAIDVLKYTAECLVDRFRNNFENETLNTKEK